MVFHWSIKLTRLRLSEPNISRGTPSFGTLISSTGTICNLVTADVKKLYCLAGVGATMATAAAFSDRLQTQLLASGLPDKVKWLIGHPGTFP